MGTGKLSRKPDKMLRGELGMDWLPAGGEGGGVVALLVPPYYRETGIIDKFCLGEGEGIQWTIGSGKGFTLFDCVLSVTYLWFNYIFPLSLLYFFL